MVPLTVETLIVVGAPGPSVLVLRPVEECISEGKFRIVPIWVGLAEAAQLNMAIRSAKTSRPATHDLLLDAITNLDARVDHVLINNVDGSVFFARLFLRQHNRIVELDARPSDAISLALRQKAPLYIDERVLNRASYPYIVKQPLDAAFAQRELSEFHSFLENVDPDDFSK